MSRIEVDKIQQQCGTTLTVGGGACKTAVVDATTVTLGRSGGTVSLASGATQSGFGRTGTVDWITTPKVTGDSPVTTVSGNGYFLNTTGGAITVNLPAGSAGDIVSFADYAGTWQTYAVTVVPNGTEKIGGTNANAALTGEGQSVTFVYVDGVQGWINTMDSTSNERGASYIVASISGACNTITVAPDCSSMKLAKFVNPGTFTVCSVASTPSCNEVGYLVVAAGGSGGGGYAGGGGGAGGFREGKNNSITPYTGSPKAAATGITVTAQAYPITVGGGGTGVAGCGTDQGNDGTLSTFDSITSAGGGGGGGGRNTCRPKNPGRNGGSGGGAMGNCGGAGTPPGGSGNSPSVAPPQGNDGGSGDSNPPAYGGGGGGGASACGGDGSSTAYGNGGAGTTSSMSGSSLSYAGGGGNGTLSPYPAPGNGGAGSPCGTGGAGSGSGSPCGTGGAGAAGSPQTGGGGGGGGAEGAGNNSGNGGSGVVIIRYKFQ